MITNRVVTCPICHGAAHAAVNAVMSAQADGPQREDVVRFECPRGCEPEFDTVPLR